MSLFPTDGAPFTMAMTDATGLVANVTITPSLITPAQGCGIDDILWIFLHQSIGLGNASWDLDCILMWTKDAESHLAHPMATLEKGAVIAAWHLGHAQASHTVPVFIDKDGITINGVTQAVTRYPVMGWRQVYAEPFEKMLHDTLTNTKPTTNATPTSVAIAFGLWDALMERGDTIHITHPFVAIMVHAGVRTGTYPNDLDAVRKSYVVAEQFSRSIINAWLVRPNRMPNPTMLVATPRYTAIAEQHRNHPGYAIGRALVTCADGCPLLADIATLHDVYTMAHLFEAPKSAHHQVAVAAWNQRIGDAVSQTLQRAGLTTP